MARELPRWNNTGVEPPELLKNEGYKKGDKIPFQYMNWFMNRSYKALEELQISKVEKLELDDFRDELLNQISNRVLVFDSASSMRANVALTAGAVIETLGYYTASDGGGARYIIVNNVTNPDGYFELRMSNGLVARLLPNATNTVNFKQLGARPQNGDIKYDNKQYLDAYLARLDAIPDRSARLKLYIPSGIWNFSPTIVQNNRGFSITGDAAITHGTISIQGTIINALNDNQATIWEIGRENRLTYNYEIGNLAFSACTYTKTGSDYVAGANYTITDCAVWMGGLNQGTVYPMSFSNLNGTALEMTSVRDSVLQRLTFRNIGDFTKPVVRMAQVTDALPTTSVAMINVNFGIFEFESVAGELIQTETRSDLYNCTIDTINARMIPFGTTILVTDATYNDLTSVKLSVLRLNGAIINLSIGEINLHAFATQVGVSAGTQYIYDTVIGTYSNLTTNTVKVMSLNTNDLGKNYNILRNFQGQPNTRSTFVFGGVTDGSEIYRGIYNVTRFPTIYVNAPISKTFGGRDLLRGSWIPAREAIRRIFFTGTNFSGMLHYDEGSESPDNLIVRPNTWLTNGNDEVFYLKNNKYCDLRMKYKFEEGTTIGFKIHELGKPEVVHNVTITGEEGWKISSILPVAANNFNESSTIVIAMQLQRNIDIDLFQWAYIPPTS